MKLTIDTNDLKTARVGLQKVRSTGPSLPILAHVLFAVKNGIATACASDL